jgi:hypothetical protein
MNLLRSHEQGQCRLILVLGIERVQPFGLGSAEKALVGGDEDEVVAAAASVLGESQRRVQDDPFVTIHLCGGEIW